MSCTVVGPVARCLQSAEGQLLCEYNSYARTGPQTDTVTRTGCLGDFDAYTNAAPCDFHDRSCTRTLPIVSDRLSEAWDIYEES